ncbi:hypothetical protein ZWY2020_014889 [Hordeum vulgare]|nr:hypothetical protein ZWY2020_014889 [Hordeum vulgare]
MRATGEPTGMELVLEAAPPPPLSPPDVFADQAATDRTSVGGGGADRADLGMPREPQAIRFLLWPVKRWRGRSILENVPLGDDANRDLLRAHIRVGNVGPFIGRLREVVGRIDKELWPEDESRQEMESLMTRLEEIPNRVQSWKKSAARCSADVALSLVRVHCNEVREEKLKTLKVANTKKLRFEDFMETFLESATRIADGIDLDTFVEPSSPGANPADA